MAGEVFALGFHQRERSAEAVVADAANGHGRLRGDAQASLAGKGVAGGTGSSGAAMTGFLRCVDCEQPDALLAAAQRVAISDSAGADGF